MLLGLLNNSTTDDKHAIAGGTPKWTLACQSTYDAMETVECFLQVIWTSDQTTYRTTKRTFAYPLFSSLRTSEMLTRPKQSDSALLNAKVSPGFEQAGRTQVEVELVSQQLSNSS